RAGPCRLRRHGPAREPRPRGERERAARQRVAAGRPDALAVLAGAGREERAGRADGERERHPEVVEVRVAGARLQLAVLDVPEARVAQEAGDLAAGDAHEAPL